jgi:hypothetical protein
MRDTEIKEMLGSTGAVVFRWLTSPRAAVVQAAEQRALEQGTVAITEALLDPAKRSQLRQVVRMAPSTRKAILISSIVAGETAATGTAAAGMTERPMDQIPTGEPCAEKDCARPVDASIGHEAFRIGHRHQERHQCGYGDSYQKASQAPHKARGKA